MSKAADTWMPLYIGDYLRKTMHLTLAQHGAYLMLIMACWCEGGTLPDDDEYLAAICRVQIFRWKKLRPALERFFKIDSAGWHNKRVSEELAKAAEIIEHRRNAGRASVAAKRQQTVNTCSTSVPTSVPTSVQQVLQQTGTPSPKKESKNTTKPSLTETSVPAREGSEGFKKIGSGLSRGRSAPSPKRDHLVQKLIRFVNATMGDPERSVTVAGLCGADEQLGEQWWLDHVDKLMRAQHWDDTERLSA